MRMFIHLEGTPAAQFRRLRLSVCDTKAIKGGLAQRQGFAIPRRRREPVLLDTAVIPWSLPGPQRE